MPSKGVLNVLVKRYLGGEYPAAAAAFVGELASGVPVTKTLESMYGVPPPTNAADSSDDEPVKPTKKASPKAAPKKAVIPDDSSDDEPVKPTKKASPKAAPKKVVADDSSDDEPVKPQVTGAKRARAETKEEESKEKIAWTHVPGQRFQRIDPTKVKFIHETLKDNSAIDLAAQFRQNQEMMRVRGKEFNKHKQKNKAKLYAAGVEMSVKSYKFGDDSD